MGRPRMQEKLRQACGLLRDTAQIYKSTDLKIAKFSSFHTVLQQRLTDAVRSQSGY